jgi:hypothetical protein
MEFAAGADRVCLSRGAAVKLLLGPERPVDFAGDSLPLPFYEWSADKA